MLLDLLRWLCIVSQNPKPESLSLPLSLEPIVSSSPSLLRGACRSVSPWLSEEAEHDKVLRRSYQRGICWLMFKRPLRWLRMLIEELHWSFFFGVIVVYGVSQALSKGFGYRRRPYFIFAGE
ncbi:unnamed protein product [Brassica oleracea]